MKQTPHHRKTSTPEERKFERITGIPCEWIPELNSLCAGRVALYIIDKSPKRALAKLLAVNLRRIRIEYMLEQNGLCSECGSSSPLHLHHKKFRSKQRDDRKENLELICEVCHRRKHGV